MRITFDKIDTLKLWKTTMKTRLREEAEAAASETMNKARGGPLIAQHPSRTEVFIADAIEAAVLKERERCLEIVQCVGGGVKHMLAERIESGRKLGDEEPSVRA